jgi:hypothetical protein
MATKLQEKCVISKVQFWCMIDDPQQALHLIGDWRLMSFSNTFGLTNSIGHFQIFIINK